MPLGISEMQAAKPEAAIRTAALGSPLARIFAARHSLARPAPDRLFLRFIHAGVRRTGSIQQIKPRGGKRRQ